MITCNDCNGCGVAIVTLDFTTDTGIQRCDTCQTLQSDAEAIALVKGLIKLHLKGRV